MVKYQIFEIKYRILGINSSTFSHQSRNFGTKHKHNKVKDHMFLMKMQILSSNIVSTKQEHFEMKSRTSRYTYNVYII